MHRKGPDDKGENQQSRKDAHKQFIVQHGRKIGIAESDVAVLMRGRIESIYKPMNCLRGKVQMTPKWIDSTVAARQQ